MLTETREAIGRPLAFLTELHGWYVTAFMFVNLINLDTNNEKQVALFHCHWRLRRGRYCGPGHDW